MGTGAGAVRGRACAGVGGRAAARRATQRRPERAARTEHGRAPVTVGKGGTIVRWPPQRLCPVWSTPSTQAREAAVAEAAADMGARPPAEAVGEHLEARPEDDAAVTHFFAAQHGGYRGWRWSVTLACADDETPRSP